MWYLFTLLQSHIKGLGDFRRDLAFKKGVWSDSRWYPLNISSLLFLKKFSKTLYFHKLSLDSGFKSTVVNQTWFFTLTVPKSSFDHFFLTCLLRLDISWNFEKFLISPDGQPIQRYSRLAQHITHNPFFYRVSQLTWELRDKSEIVFVKY